MEEHVHVVASIPPRLAVASFVGQLKGASSHWINHELIANDWFEWQEGYGVLSFGKQALPRVVDYVVKQKERHRERRLFPIMERVGEE